MKEILDACCGSRMFWFDKHNPHTLYIDKRNEVLTAKDRDKIRTILLDIGYNLDCPCCKFDNSFIFNRKENIQCHTFQPEELPLVLWEIENNKTDLINCIGNSKLFLAIAALRDDSDYMQWFAYGNEFILCDREDWIDMISTLCCGGNYNYDKNGELSNLFHKATVNELIEHFK